MVDHSNAQLVKVMTKNDTKLASGLLMADVLKQFIWKLINGSWPTDHQTRKGPIPFERETVRWTSISPSPSMCLNSGGFGLTSMSLAMPQMPPNYKNKEEGISIAQGRIVYS